MSDSPHVMIVEARFYADISDYLAEGAIAALESAGASFERYEVPGALEIPAAISFGHIRQSGLRFDAFVALGCVIRGETSHYDIVAGESARALMDLTVHEGLAIGNGILTCDTRDQALVRARPDEKNKGGDAVMAALSLWQTKKHFGLKI